MPHPDDSTDKQYKASHIDWPTDKCERGDKGETYDATGTHFFN